MEIKLEQLDHQIGTIEAICHVLDGVPIEHTTTNSYQNPTFDPHHPKIADNLYKIQRGSVNNIKPVPKALWGRNTQDDILGIDAKLETGTGKTYTFTRLMYELHVRYGFFKFVLLAPSVSIREGTKNFIESEYAKRHFADIYQNVTLNLEVLEAQKNRGKKKTFPSAVSAFARGTIQEKNRIYAMLTSGAMLTSSTTMAYDYDQQEIGGFTIPYEALKATRPIVIIDEPHRFRRTQATYQTLIKELDPLLVIRFGATFPKEGTGKNERTDYNNLVYNLGAVEAFNSNLVKGVAVQHLAAVDEEENRFRLMSVANRKVATFRNERTKKLIDIEKGGSLSQLDDSFEGITLATVGKSDYGPTQSVLLSNEHVVHVKEDIYGTIYGLSYQEKMIQQALEIHFETEKENFYRDNKIKTLCLFFIDDIQSYRTKEEEPGHLRLFFQQELTERLKKEIELIDKQPSPSEREKEYKSFLQASLADIKKTNGGYFSQDNSTSEKDIEEEVDKILRDKASLLTFKDKQGHWNTMRFIFSKWTLREGWDNPNIFTIVKLRSSGSEISKLQEVGRGLRLPVDERGNRLSDKMTNDSFYLTVLLDFTEKDFAEQLKAEINAGVGQVTKLSAIELEKAAKKLEMTVEDLMADLLRKRFIDIHRVIVPEKREELFDEYPDLNVGLNPGKVKKEGEKTGTIRVRSEQFEQLRSLWEMINQKYFIEFAKPGDEELECAITDILNQDIFKTDLIHVTEQRSKIVNDDIEFALSTVNTYKSDTYIPYGEFLKRIHKATALPISLVHNGFVERSKTRMLEKSDFTFRSLRNFITLFSDWFVKTYETKFTYHHLSKVKGATALTTRDGQVKKEIPINNVGVYRAINKTIPDQFLYDQFVYDSKLEEENIEQGTSPKITVFGKIPKNSIRIPKFNSGTTSPDFMYVVKKSEGGISINMILETKSVESKKDISESEKITNVSAKKFFETLQADGFDVTYQMQLKGNEIEHLIETLKE